LVGSAAAGGAAVGAGVAAGAQAVRSMLTIISSANREKTDFFIVYFLSCVEIKADRLAELRADL
jgi:hypothetical protein